MVSRPAGKSQKRRGTIVALAAVMMVVLLGMVAFAVDLGYILVDRADLQGAADAAVLAAVRELAPNEYGVQETSLQTVRDTVRSYANKNINSPTWFKIPDADIEIGRYDRNTVYSGGSLVLLNDGILDTVRVTLRQDGVTNDSLSLFFARILGINEAVVEVSATAMMPPVETLDTGDRILPFAIRLSVWETINTGDMRNVYPDRAIDDETGKKVPGSWGTVDVGDDANSTDAMGTLITGGLTQSDLDALASQTAPDTGLPRIPDNTELPAGVWLNSDTGISAGLHDPLQEVIGETLFLPIYDSVTGSGDTAEFHISSWGVIKLVDADLSVATGDMYVQIQRCYTYDAALTPTSDLSSGNTLEGLFAGAVLVE